MKKGTVLTVTMRVVLLEEVGTGITGTEREVESIIENAIDEDGVLRSLLDITGVSARAEV
jgi:hypothetical protein